MNKYILRKNERKVIKYTLSKVNGKFANQLTPLEISRDKNKYGKLRKTAILEKLPIEQWTKNELLDLIEKYDIYFIILSALNKNSENPKKILPISLYVNKGEYKRLEEEYEEYRKD